MNKEISIFIKAEKWWKQEIQKVFNDLFDKSLWSIKKMAELSLVLDNRRKANLDNEQVYVLYCMLWSEIWQWSSNLSTDEYNEFCKLSGFSSIIKIN